MKHTQFSPILRKEGNMTQLEIFEATQITITEVMAPNKDIDMAEILIISIKGSSKGTTNQILLLIVKVGPSLNKGPTPLDNPLGPPLPTQIPIKLSPVNITKG